MFAHQITVLLLLCVASSLSIRLVSYHIPSVIDFRDEAVLSCEFDPENEVLHTVRWLLNGTEFYRWSRFRGNVYRYADGISIRANKSNKTTVVLAPLYFTTSGEFRCEGSTAPPLHRSLAISKKMFVVALPKGGPLVEGAHPSHTWGEDLLLNCTSPPSFPAAEIVWTVNDEQVPDSQIRHLETEEDSNLRIRSTKTEIRLRPEQLPFESHDGEVIVSCVAYVPGVYKNTASLRLSKAQAVKSSNFA